MRAILVSVLTAAAALLAACGGTSGGSSQPIAFEWEYLSHACSGSLAPSCLIDVAVTVRNTSNAPRTVYEQEFDVELDGRLDSGGSFCNMPIRNPLNPSRGEGPMECFGQRLIAPDETASGRLSFGVPTDNIDPNSMAVVYEANFHAPIRVGR